MNLIDKLKGVLRKMIGPKTVESALSLTPTISSKMKDAIELWEMMYKDESPWCGGNSIDGEVNSLGLASMIASEKARTATIEMKIKITGETPKAEFIKEQFDKVLKNLRPNLEFGIALGGLVIKPYVVQGPKGYKVEFSYVKATDFYPLAFSPEGSVTEAAFIDRIITKDITYSKLEYHSLRLNTLTIKTMCFRKENNTHSSMFSDNELGDPISLKSVPQWSEITPEVVIDNVDRLLFAYFKMPQANNIDLDSPLGVSGFSRAVKLIEQADKMYSNLLWEFEGGQLAIDVDRTALNPLKDSKGNVKEVLPKLQQRLFRKSLDLGDDNTYEVFSPQLRDSNIINGLNNILMHIEDVCEISRGTLSEVNYTDARTATELKILKQRSFAANTDIQKELEDTLNNVIEIIDMYCDLYSIVPDGEYEVAYNWDDSIIVDKDAERQVDLIDVNTGLLSKIEYRMKWMGETEQQAEEAINNIQDQKTKELETQQQVMVNAQQQLSDNGQQRTEAQEKNDKLNRANESNETTKGDKKSKNAKG